MEINMPKKTVAMKPVPQRDAGSDIGSGIFGLAKSIESVAEELRPPWKIELLTDNLGEIAQQLAKQVHVQELSLIAQHGTDEDRKAIVKYVKQYTAPFGEY
jgi:hypothetical protein